MTMQNRAKHSRTVVISIQQTTVDVVAHISIIIRVYVFFSVRKQNKTQADDQFLQYADGLLFLFLFFFFLFAGLFLLSSSLCGFCML